MKKNRISFILLLFEICAVCCSACSSDRSTANDASVTDTVTTDIEQLLIDVDMGLDDARVILSIPFQNQFHVAGIVTIEGSGGAVKGADNALKLLAAVGADEIPVVVGATSALNGPIQPPIWRSMADNLGGLSLPEAPKDPENIDAETFIAGILEQSAKPVRILAIGPVTNIARVIDENPPLLSKIHSIHLLGDFISCNCYNCETDEDAAQIVLQSGIPVFMVLGSATNLAPFDSAFLSKVEDLDGPAAKLIAEMMKNHSDGSMKLWDDSVLAGLIESETLDYEKYNETISEAGSLDKAVLETLLLDLWDQTSPIMP